MSIWWALPPALRYRGTPLETNRPPAHGRPGIERDLGVWARGARTPFEPAPAAPFASLKGSPRANGPRPHGCELTRSEPLPWTLRIGSLDNYRVSQRLVAVRSAVAPQDPSPGQSWCPKQIPISAECQNQGPQGMGWKAETRNAGRRVWIDRKGRQPTSPARSPQHAPSLHLCLHLVEADHRRDHTSVLQRLGQILA